MATHSQIISAASVSLDIVCEAFNEGFQDYKYGTRFNPEQMQHYLQHLGANRHDCAVLVTNGASATGQGIAVLAVSGVRAWCGGLAVAPQYRRAGYANALMEAIETTACARDADTITLEVLTENEAALTLYRKRAYRTVRTLQIWQKQPTDASSAAAYQFNIEQIDTKTLLSRLQDTARTDRPAWQRSPHYLQQSASDLTAIAIYDEDREIQAYALYRLSTSGEQRQSHMRIADVGWMSGRRSTADVAGLLLHLQHAYPEAQQTLLNEPDDSPLSLILAEFGFHIIETQLEMVKQLVPSA